MDRRPSEVLQAVLENVEHTAMARGEFLELTIVALIVLEIVLALAGL